MRVVDYSRDAEKQTNRYEEVLEEKKRSNMEITGEMVYSRKIFRPRAAVLRQMKRSSFSVSESWRCLGCRSSGSFLRTLPAVQFHFPNRSIFTVNRSEFAAGNPIQYSELAYVSVRKIIYFMFILLCPGPYLPHLWTSL